MKNLCSEESIHVSFSKSSVPPCRRMDDCHNFQRHTFPILRLRSSHAVRSFFRVSFGMVGQYLATRNRPCPQQQSLGHRRLHLGTDNNDSLFDAVGTSSGDTGWVIASTSITVIMIWILQRRLKRQKNLESLHLLNR